MVKMIWIVLTVHNGVISQKAAEYSKEQCLADIQSSALQLHDFTHVGDAWWCQPAIRWEPEQ